MTPKRTQQLFAAFPDLYRLHKEDATVSAMCFGFQCGDGWFQPLYRLSAAIEEAARAECLEPNSPAWPKVWQVKQKFGSLRVIVEIDPVPGFDPRPLERTIATLIEKAEAEYLNTCEACGATGADRVGGNKYRLDFPHMNWVYTLCPACAQLYMERKLRPYSS